MTTTKIKITHPKAAGRYHEHMSIRGVPVEAIRQKSGKLDNVIIDFTGRPFDEAVLYDVREIDPYNCFPYVIITADAKRAQDALSTLGMTDASWIKDPTVDKTIIKELLLLASISKGFSKGANASKSQKLDDALMSYVQTLANAINPDVVVMKPREKGTTNEDLRMLVSGVPFFRQENKSISVKLNITERAPMVGGKALLNTGDLDDLLVSFVGYEDSFIDITLKTSPAHIAKAYVEFSVPQQKQILSGDTSPFDSVRVQYPVDLNDITKGVTMGDTLKEFYINVIKNAPVV